MQEEEEEEEEERNGVAEDEEMAEANGDAGGGGALSLANGAGPLHDEDDEEPENAVVLHEVCASLCCVVFPDSSPAGRFPAKWQESRRKATWSDAQVLVLAALLHERAMHKASRAAVRYKRQWQTTL